MSTTITTSVVSSVKRAGWNTIDKVDYGVQSLAISADKKFYIIGNKINHANILDGLDRVTVTRNPKDLKNVRVYLALAGHANGSCIYGDELFIASAKNANNVAEKVPANQISVFSTYDLHLKRRITVSELSTVSAVACQNGTFYLTDGSCIARTKDFKTYTKILESGIKSKTAASSSYAESELSGQGMFIFKDELYRVFSVKKNAAFVGCLCGVFSLNGEFLRSVYFSSPGEEVEDGDVCNGVVFFLTGHDDTKIRIWDPDNKYKEGEYPMAIQAENRIYPGSNFSATDMAILMEHVSVNDDGILSGCEISKLSSKEINVTPGYALLHGRLVYITGGKETVPTQSTETKYSVLLKLDLADGATPTVTIVTSTPDDTPNANLVNGSISASLGWVWTNSSGITKIATRALSPNNATLHKQIKGSKVSGAVSKIAKAKTWYALQEIKLTPGLYEIFIDASIGGVSGGTGGSNLQLYDKTNSKALRTVRQQHSANITIYPELHDMVRFNYTDNDRNAEMVIQARVYSDSTNRAVSISRFTAYRMQ